MARPPGLIANAGGALTALSAASVASFVRSPGRESASAGVVP